MTQPSSEILDDASHHMQCMEIWGGNVPVDTSVSMSGLDAWVYCKPFGQAQQGGDVYYMSSCATGRIARLLLADVSGHGASVAQTARGLRRLMQRYVNYIDQNAFVRSMNRQFASLSQETLFATAIVSTYFAPTRELTLCIAGHPPPLLYRVSTKSWSALGSHDDPSVVINLPLGIDDVRDWAQFGIRLEEGDLVVCYTDSLSESKDRDGELLGTRGLLDVVSHVSTDDAKQFVPRLLEAVAARHEGNLDNDDVTVLLFRPTAAPGALSFRDRLVVPLRIVVGGMKQLWHASLAIPWPELSVRNTGGFFLKRLNYWRARP